ncbi:MAG: TIGR00180 family glycosyltransferase [Opitutales bacterium]|nr:TIGR00180 family glycosyltransferase [Opitutales bacterium]
MAYDIELAKKLTIITPLYGRHEMTLRHLLYLEAVRCPFKVYITDGSFDDKNLEIIEANKHRFSHVNYEYHRYPAGAGLLEFFKRMADTLAKITTPYVIRYDNDDFLDMDALLQYIAFLDQDSQHEYIACMGQIHPFTTRHNQCFGKINALYKPRYYWSDYELDSVEERLRGCDDENEASVMRRQVSQTAYAESVAHEYKLDCFLTLYPSTLGKTKVLPSVYKYKQMDCTLWRNQDNNNRITQLLTTDEIAETQREIGAVIESIGLTGERAETLKKQLILDWFGMQDPKTLHQFVEFLFYLDTSYFRKVLKLYNWFTVSWLRRLPATIRYLYLNNSKTLQTIKQVLRNG